VRNAPAADGRYSGIAAVSDWPRAGEQGRGFAVVAGEVRTLAQRSAEAAKDVKALIADSVARIESGSGEADRAGRTVGEVVAAIRQVSDLVGGSAPPARSSAPASSRPAWP
jgi:methyl-accepting chemotaxis protein